MAQQRRLEISSDANPWSTSLVIRACVDDELQLESAGVPEENLDPGGSENRNLTRQPFFSVRQTQSHLRFFGFESEIQFKGAVGE